MTAQREIPSVRDIGIKGKTRKGETSNKTQWIRFSR